MRKSFALFLNILITLVIIGVLYLVLIKMNFGTSLSDKDAPPEFKGSAGPAAVINKSKAVVSDVNSRLKEHEQEARAALGY